MQIHLHLQLARHLAKKPGISPHIKGVGFGQTTRSPIDHRNKDTHQLRKRSGHASSHESGKVPNTGLKVFQTILLKNNKYVSMS